MERGGRFLLGRGARQLGMMASTSSSVSSWWCARTLVGSFPRNGNENVVEGCGAWTGTTGTTRRGYASKKQAKSKASQGKRSGKGGKGLGSIAVPAKVEATTKGNKLTYLEALTPTPREGRGKETLTEEELEEFERRAKEYSRMKMRQERDFQRDLNEKIRIKMAAIAALPEGETRDAAMVEDTELFPLKRRLPSATPPIPGYYEEKQRLAEEAVAGGAALKK